MSKTDAPIRCKTQDESYEQAAKALDDADVSVVEAWQHPENVRGGSLFLYCSPRGNAPVFGCGCLTQVRDGKGQVVGFGDKINNRLTDAICADEMIPCSVHSLVEELRGHNRGRVLKAFIRWQKRLDREAAKLGNREVVCV